jgi:hypothetical protein
MRTRLVGLLAFLVLLPIAPSAMAADSAISRTPEGAIAMARQFWGEYNAKLADCGAARSETRLVVEPKTLRFYESAGEVREIITLSPNDVVVLAKFAGEGERWSSMRQFSLSNDGKVLTTRTPRSADLDQSDGRSAVRGSR